MLTPRPRLLSILLTLGLALPALAAVSTPVQSERLTKAWEASAPLPGASAAFHDEEANTIFVSRSEGNVKDGNVRGFIAQLDADGKVLAADWVSGLDAPRGLARTKTRLIVVDGQELLSIDPERARIASRYRNDAIKRLHSVAVLKTGVIFATDTGGGSMYELRDGIFGRYSGIESVPANTALLAAGDELLLGQKFRITGFTPASERSRDVVRRGASIESMIALGDGTFIVCDGKSALHLVGAGVDKPVKLLDTGTPADGLGLIGFVAAQRLVLVPLPASGRVVAYKFN